MKIKNISGKRSLFSLGRRSMELAINEIVNLQDEPAVVAAVQALAAEGKLQVIEGPATSQNLSGREALAGFAVKVGAITQWLATNTLNIEGVVFEVTTNGTRTIPGSILVDKSGGVTTDAHIAASFAAAMNSAAGVAALKRVGVTLAGLRTLNAVSVLAFTLDTNVLPLSLLSVTITKTGSTGAAPTYSTVAETSSKNASVSVVDVTVPVGATSVVVTLPYAQLLSAPSVTIRNPAGVLQAAPSATYVDGSTVELTGLTAGHIATIVAFTR